MKKTGILATLVIITNLLASCGREENEVNQSDPEPIQVDLILVNGKVITVDDEFSIHSVVVVHEGRIVQTGDQSLLQQFEADTVIDLQGKTVMPGFIDSHTHIRGRPKRFIDLGDVNSIAEMQSLIRVKVAELSAGDWITGYGWSEDELAEGRKPQRQDLDQAAPENPVTLTRAGGHSAVVNSLALKLANIGKDTQDPDGGIIERDNDGTATGIIRERQRIVGRLVPQSTDEELIASLQDNLAALLSLGITSITDASKRPDDYLMWEALYAEDNLKLPRAMLQFQWRDPEKIKRLKTRVGDGTDFLKIGPIKVFADGGFTGPAAYTIEPYLNQGDYRGYTITGAYLNFQEHDKGSLEPGKFADMIVLSDDILSIDPEKIIDIRVDETYIDGKMVFKREPNVLVGK